MIWLAVDVGGANLKVSDGKTFADSSSFALWREPKQLVQELRTLIAEAPLTDHLILTMTGELADCFSSKQEGVQFILDAVQEAAASRHTRCYLVDGRAVTFQVAKRLPELAAASNWHALARFAGRFAPEGPAVLIDIGSTTCDLIPLWDGEPDTEARSDLQRLQAGQLLFTGVERSPVCAVVRHVPYRSQALPVSHELFATMLDAYIILGDLPENTAMMATADGRPATKSAARARLGRLICAEADEFHHRDAVLLAQAAADAQLKLLSDTLTRVMQPLRLPPETVILSGQGEFLARRALQSLQLTPKVISLSRELGGIASKCATAYALACLMNEARV